MPPATVAWVEDVVGPGHRVVGVAALDGATSSAVHAVTTADRRGERHHYVLRRYTRADWLAREPDLAEREAEALVLVESVGVPTPVLVAADVAGERTDVPAVLMTRLPGAAVPAAELGDRRVAALARLLPVLHATAVPRPSALRPYHPYHLDRELHPPSWSADPHLWERAFEIHAAGSPPGPGALIHRDFHPGNVLFAGGEASGVVDWAVASFGRPEVDVGHCRTNLALLASPQAADDFRSAWLAASGIGAYDPTFDILAVVGGLDEGGGFIDHDHGAAEQLIARALAELGR